MFSGCRLQAMTSRLLHGRHTHWVVRYQRLSRAVAVRHRLVQISSRHRTVSSPQPRSFASTETVAVLQWPGIGLFRAPRQNMYVAPGAQEPLTVSLCEPSSAPPFVNLALHHLPLCTFLFSSARNDGGETNPHNDGGETNPTLAFGACMFRRAATIEAPFRSRAFNEDPAIRSLHVSRAPRRAPVCRAKPPAP